MKATEIDRDKMIAKYVLNHPELTRPELAKLTGLSESTLNRRLTAMQESGDISNRYVLGPENRLYSTRALIGVKLKTIKLGNAKFNFDNQRKMLCLINWGLGEFPEFSAARAGVILERVEQAFGGPYELVILIAALDANALGAFTTEVIHKLPGVIETTTSLLVSYTKSSWNPPKAKRKKSAKEIYATG